VPALEHGAELEARAIGSGDLVADSPVLPIINMADMLVPTINDLSDDNTFDYEIGFWVVLSLFLAGLIVLVTYASATCVQRRSTAVQCSTGIGSERTPLVRAGSVRTPRKHTVSHNEHKDIFNI
jgi:hypothetical protein